MAIADIKATSAARPAADKWTKDNATVLIICVLGWAFDIYEQTIMQVVTPILIKEWGITPATMGNVTTISRWLGLLGTLIFPMLADLYGRKPMLILSILGYSLFTGLTGFATGWITLLIFTSINRVALAGELPIGLFEFAQVLLQAFQKERALYGCCQLICEDLHDRYVIRGKGFWLFAMDIEDTDQVALHFEGQCHL